MLEACHRGFQNIVELLIRGGADLKYIPSAEESNLSPFVSAPAQTALAESARCGFHGIVQVVTEVHFSWHFEVKIKCIHDNIYFFVTGLVECWSSKESSEYTRMDSPT